MQNFGHLKNKEGFLDLMKNSFLAGSYFVFIKVYCHSISFNTYISELSKKRDFLKILLTIISSGFIFKSTYKFHACT